MVKELVKTCRNPGQLSMAGALYFVNPQPNLLRSVPQRFRSTFGGNVRSVHKPKRKAKADTSGGKKKRARHDQGKYAEDDPDDDDNGTDDQESDSERTASSGKVCMQLPLQSCVGGVVNIQSHQNRSAA